MRTVRFRPDIWDVLVPSALPAHRAYLTEYLNGLGCEWVLIEESYFDRDYLSEFYAFYGGCAKPYRHRSSRLHFFRSEKPRLDSRALRRLMSGSSSAMESWQKRYIGFCVIRPIPGAPFGRTVLPLWPERDAEHPRVGCGTRAYAAHVSGIPFTVEQGLAWQQQDTGVSTCATVSLWSMLHSVAFREGLKVPTTVEITQAATRHSLELGRVFPSDGLSVFQICEAIRAFELSPLVCEGNLHGIRPDGKALTAFSGERFTSYLATLLRAGFPVLIGCGCDLGAENEGDHAVCAVGFRASAGPAVGAPGAPTAADSSMDYVYLHDDNVGPAVRCCVREEAPTWATGSRSENGDEPAILDGQGDRLEAVVLEADPSMPEPGARAKPLIPFVLVAAVPVKMRAAPGELLKMGLDLASAFLEARPSAAIEFSAFICRQADYFGPVVERTLHQDGAILAKARLAAAKVLGGMSRYLGVTRLTNDSKPLVDLLWDTTDVRANDPLLGALAFDASAHAVIEILMGVGFLPPKPVLRAFSATN